MSQPKAIKPVSAQSGLPSQWYIKGSYVLDVVFAQRLGNATHAADVDVFHLRKGAPPTKTDIGAVLQKAALPPPPGRGIDGPVPVDDLGRLDGGGDPVFNIDLWHIREDGKLYSLRASGPVPLDPDGPEAAGPLRLLGAERVPSAKHALKAVMKMAFYPPLYDRRLVRTLGRIVDNELK